MSTIYIVYILTLSQLARRPKQSKKPVDRSASSGSILLVELRLVEPAAAPNVFSFRNCWSNQSAVNRLGTDGSLNRRLRTWNLTKTLYGCRVLWSPLNPNTLTDPPSAWRRDEVPRHGELRLGLKRVLCCWRVFPCHRTISPLYKVGNFVEYRQSSV